MYCTWLNSLFLTATLYADLYTSVRMLWLLSREPCQATYGLLLVWNAQPWSSYLLQKAILRFIYWTWWYSAGLPLNRIVDINPHEEKLEQRPLPPNCASIRISDQGILSRKVAFLLIAWNGRPEGLNSSKEEDLSIATFTQSILTVWKVDKAVTCLRSTIDYKVEILRLTTSKEPTR